MSFSTILTKVDGPSYVITLNRPERRNAIGVKTLDELMAAVGEAEELPEVVGVILTGGTEYFSSGADLNDAAAISTRSEGLTYFGRWHRLNDTLESLGKPVIAAIEGFCMTGGCELALACDLRVAGEGASFAITSSRIGTVAGAGGTQRLPRLIGSAKALEMMFSADPIDATEAHRIGLINRLVARGQALAEAKAMVEVYAGRAPLSLAWCKRAVHRGMQMDLAAGLEFETFLVSTIYATNDRKEGIAAFLEKRLPQFKGN
jgi:enoyl-CoA hydratase/carnithine racemase